MGVLIDFLRVLAWAVLSYGVFAVVLITVSRAIQTPAEEALDRLMGRRWHSRGWYVLAAFVAAAWLYASWGR